MFSWVCPKCGKEVPPAYSECPNCPKPQEAVTTAPAAEPAPVVAAPAPPPSTPVASPPPAVPVAAAPPPPPPAPVAAPPARRGSHWLSALVAMIVVAGVLAGIYFLIPKARNGTATAAAPESAAQAPVAPATAAHPLAKDVELTGIRITEGRNQRVQVRFIAVNHSAAELPETKLHVTLKRGGQEDIMDFPFTLPSLGPHESREITANTRTRLRGYEMPDWQFISVEFTDPEGQPAR